MMYFVPFYPDVKCILVLFFKPSICLKLILFLNDLVSVKLRTYPFIN